ncbi:MAG: Heimdall-CTERM domain-containing surface protein [Candidatus Hodarchaeota archaeon]
MKKKFFVGISVIVLLMILIFTSPAQAVDPTDFAGHNFEENFFAIEVDLVGAGTSVFDPDQEHPDLIRDLLDDTPDVSVGDSKELEDLQFFLAYMNNSGIETAFSALEKFEHMLTFKDFIDEETYNEIYTAGAFVPALRNALTAPLSHVNGTAPFQQLVQHYTTSEDTEFKDVFVTNNFMSLIAYSNGTGDNTDVMDKKDSLFIGYTFAIQNLTDAINDALELNGHDRIDYYDVESSFETIDDHTFEFGVRYENLLVLWQSISVKPKSIDVFDGGADDRLGEFKGIVYGHGIAAASVLDHLEFNYVFETEEFHGANEYIEGRVTTHYNIGETNLLITRDNQSYIDTHAVAWNNNPFAGEFSYTVFIPDEIADYDFSTIIPSLPDIPNSVTVDLPELAFFVGDDAKTRMMKTGGFGLSVATSTTTFGVDVDGETYEKDGDDINVKMGGKTYFFTEFTDKMTYKLLGLEDLWDIDPTLDRPVHVHPFDPIGWGVEDFGLAKAYFIVEFALAYGFTAFMAKELTGFVMSEDTKKYVEVDLLYFTFTDFPEWFGGEIVHDPTYSAVAAMAAEGMGTSATESSEGPGESSEGIPGFEILSAILAILPLYALYRKRRT